MCEYMNTCTETKRDKFAYLCLFVYIDICTLKYIRIHTYIYINVYMYIYIYIYIYIIYLFKARREPVQVAAGDTHTGIAALTTLQQM